MSFRSWLRDRFGRKPKPSDAPRSISFDTLDVPRVTRERAAEARQYLDNFALGRDRAEEVRRAHLEPRPLLGGAYRRPIRPALEHDEIDLTGVADAVETIAQAAVIISSTASEPAAEPVHHHTIYHEPVAATAEAVSAEATSADE